MVFNGPIDLILSTHDVMQPDLVVSDPASVTRRGIEAMAIDLGTIRRL